MSDDVVGPCLPPGFGQKAEQGSQSSDDSEDDIGPALPPSMGKEGKQQDDSDDDVYGPLPPQHLTGKKPSEPAKETSSAKKRVLGPALPPGFSVASQDSESSDEELVGPSLDMAAPANAQYDAAAEFTARNRSFEAERKRIEDEKMQQAAGREEWMMSLPTVGLAQDIGLTARTFRNKAAPQQDSSWTKAPNDKAQDDEKEAKKSSSKRQHDNSHMGNRDQEISEKLQKFNDSERQESLVAMHQKKIKKEKKKEKEKGEAQERVPFSRETDLQVNKFDDAQRKNILKKAALLDTRFGHGSQKYE